MKPFVHIAALCVLTACAQPGPPTLPDPAEDSCGGAPHAALVGQDATALERVLIIGPVRVIRPGMAVTMDYRPDRINFEIGQDGRIVRIYCG